MSSVAIRAVKFGTSDRAGSVPTLTSSSKVVLVRSLVQMVADFDDRVVWNDAEMLKLKSSLKNLPPNISDDIFKSIFVNKAKNRGSVSLFHPDTEINLKIGEVISGLTSDGLFTISPKEPSAKLCSGAFSAFSA